MVTGLLNFFCITSLLFSQSPYDSLNKDQYGRYLDIWLENGDREINCLVFPPSDSLAVPGLILIHEEWGLTDWVKSVSEQIAAEGYLVIVPDLLSGNNPEYDSLLNFTNEGVIRAALLNSDNEQIMSDLDVSFKYMKDHPCNNGQIGVIGFSWGGTQAFLYMTENPGLSAGYVFYGSSPKDKKVLSRIQSPVYGIYGEYDSRINSSIRNTERRMRKFGKDFHPFIIDGGGHGFMRSGERKGATEDNVKARTAGWKKLTELLLQM